MLRRIKYHYDQLGEIVVFIENKSNNLELTISEIPCSHWRMELFS